MGVRWQTRNALAHSLRTKINRKYINNMGAAREFVSLQAMIFRYMRYEVSKNMPVVVTSSKNLITHKLRVEMDQKDISVVWSKQIWGTDYVRAKNGRYQYSVLSEQLTGLHTS